jgi:hypothetical protein
MSQEPERRRRRRGYWRLAAVPTALLLLAGSAYAVALVHGSAADNDRGVKSAATEQGLAVVSPPLAAGGSGQASINSGSGSSANGSSNNGNANGNANGKSLSVALVSATPIYPGRTGTLTLRVDNTNQQDVVLTSVTSAVTSVTTGTKTGIPACNKSWFQIGGLVGTALVNGRSARTITVPVTMVNTSNVNQDNCKGVTYTFSFTVNGRQA